MPLVKAQCTNCGAALEVDNSKEAAICPFCNTPYIVEKAINNYITNVTNNIQAQNVTIIGGKDFNQMFNSAKALLGVSHKQGLEACNEALSLQPTNYEVWALRAKYAVNGYEDVNQAIQKVVELAPAESVAEVLKDIMTYLIDFRKKIPPMDPYTELGTYYLSATKLNPEDSVIFATEILSLMESKIKFIKMIGSYVDIMNNVVARKERDLVNCSQEFKAKYENREMSSGALCKGAEQTVFEDGGTVWFNYNGKCVNKGGFLSAANGLLTITNYKITYETGNPKTSFEKSLETLTNVTTFMSLYIKLIFSDGYDVQIPSPQRTAQDAAMWVEKIKNLLF